ncbi:MAG: amidohydrolase [Bacteroidales bacterium]|nr:amidohydrolase [Bacteroidales bacterium]
MNNTLKISIIQTELFWENKEENLNNFQNKIENLSGKTDLIILPEMFTTGFSMKPEEFAESMNGKTVSWMKVMTKSSGAAIAGSIIIEENKKFYNRFLFVSEQGIEYYDKRHLFAMAGEDKYYEQGKENLLIKYKGWKIRPQICYDLRFPVWSRNTDEYDLLIYVANWPEKRVAHWNTLLKARAIENQSYVAGINRIGFDGNNYPHSGDSAVYDAMGEKISKTKANEESVETIALSLDELKKTRKNLPFLQDKDKYNIC